MKNEISKFYQTQIVARRWLSEQIFEISFNRPEGFTFIPGQKVQLKILEIAREYTLINAPGDPKLTICVRYVDAGRFTPMLAQTEIGTEVILSQASGFFTYQSQENKAVFVATGTGVAPFLAFVRAGITGFILLYGGRNRNDLIYGNEFSAVSSQYITCITTNDRKEPYLKRRVTDYLEENLHDGIYDFYLCGNKEMICDAFEIIDRKFPGSKIFSEPFF